MKYPHAGVATGSREARNRTQPAGLFPLRVLYSPPSRRRCRVGLRLQARRHKKPTGLTEVGTAVWGVSRLLGIEFATGVEGSQG